MFISKMKICSSIPLLGKSTLSILWETSLPLTPDYVVWVGWYNYPHSSVYCPTANVSDSEMAQFNASQGESLKFY